MTDVVLTTPISYYGGKQRMLQHILPLLPVMNLYCEPYVGGGAVFWAKEPSRVEVINKTFDQKVSVARDKKNQKSKVEVLTTNYPI